MEEVENKQQFSSENKGGIESCMARVVVDVVVVVVVIVYVLDHTWPPSTLLR